MDAPILFQWSGDGMVPASRHWAEVADRAYVVGEKYALVQQSERSDKSHAFYFAQINDMWESLPDHLAEQFKSPEMLRKHALIRCNYADKRSIVCASKAEALRVAAFIQPMDTYAVVSVDAATVTVWIAQSQSYRSMDRKSFEASKSEVLGWIADLLGLSADAEQRRAA